MKCPKCNKTYNNNFNFCPYCGEKKPEPKICPNCMLEPSTEFNFCPECGTQLMPKSKLIEIINYLNEKIKEYEELEEYEKAIEYYDKAIEHEPENISYWEGKLRCLKKLGRYNATKECEKKVESLRKSKP